MLFIRQSLFTKYTIILTFCCLCAEIKLHAAVTNPVDTEPPIAQELIFQNRSILKCGVSQNETILTLLDVRVLLAISNFISKNPVPLTTDWNSFSDPKINLYRLSPNIPQDVLRVLFLCLNWQEAKLANLFVNSEETLNKYLQEIKLERPWKVYSMETQHKIDQLPDAFLKEMIDMVLRAEQGQTVRGTLKTNSSLRTVKFTWLL